MSIDMSFSSNDRPSLSQAELSIFNAIRGIHSSPGYITNITLSNTPISPKVFLYIMQLTSYSLTYAFFSITACEALLSLPIQLSQPITMLSMERLRITAAGRHQSLPLRLPVIKDLWIGWFDKYHSFQWEMRQYAGWLAGLSRSLERLVLVDLSACPLPGRLDYPRTRMPSIQIANYTALEALLRAAPNLRILSLPRSIRITLPIQIDITSGTLLPRLNTLELATDRDPDALLLMMERRNRAGPASGLIPIVSLRLSIPSTLFLPQGDIDVKMSRIPLLNDPKLIVVPQCQQCRTDCSFGI